MRYFVCSLLFVFFVSDAFADSRRGLITTTSCPYTCFDAGLSNDVCRERKVGDTCQIEDLTQAPGHRSMVRVKKDVPAKVKSAARQQLSVDPNRRGLVTSSSCPFTCADLDVPKAYCREKQLGAICQVEDLRQAPGHRSLVRVPK